jgi:hypothetical protein
LALCEINTFFNENRDGVDHKVRNGFSKFLKCLDSYLSFPGSNIEIFGETRVNTYKSVTLEDGSIMRATSSFHNKPWFSDIAVLMDSEESNDYLSDQGLCYGQVILCMFYLYIRKAITDICCLQALLLVEILTDPPLNLALIQWYDFKSKKYPYKYGCPHLKLKESYHFIAIEAIQGIVHIVPRFGKDNEYFVNKYIF